MSSQLIEALAAADESIRLKAALALGSNPDPAVLDALLARCASEPDWRAAAVLVPRGQAKALAEELAAQLGRGGPEVQLSLRPSAVKFPQAKPCARAPLVFCTDKVRLPPTSTRPAATVND